MPLFDLVEGETPLILSFPHSGTDVPSDIAQHLGPVGRGLCDTDWHVPRLYDFAREMGVTWLAANISRTVIDLNRDPSSVSLYPGQATTDLCPLETFDGEPLWQAGKAPDADEVERRKEKYFMPYHQGLAEQIARIKARHGFAVLYDCHSIRGTVPRLFEGALPSLNLGTDQGKSCGRLLEQDLSAVLARSSYTHVLNGRFRGGWITRHYGRPKDRVHAVQMEIAQREYMEERPPWLWHEERATALQSTLKDVLEAILQWARKEGASGGF
ncbi:MAG: N-formylglutamate deformylase [Robiginitomaculum sp.]|nr:N-formylglutamate deformylase [Robiginitomaculum sp.]MDQ7078559.1 N-formylglutamate deformylase [Robiginitomaculum sp.]